jgi:hypothetical protein
LWFILFLKLKFIPGTFKLVKEHLGELSIEKKWLDCSLVLTEEEFRSLSQMTEAKDGILLYRATLHGFDAKSFHSKCDGKKNTITIIKTDGNYVFGGFTAAEWSSYCGRTKDTKAFLFSLRRRGCSSNYKLMVKDVNDAIYGSPYTGPKFGRHDIEIIDHSNRITGSVTNLGYGYHTAPKSGEDSRFFLSTTEIEVYQINK